jgi:hypothetical protein
MATVDKPGKVSRSIRIKNLPGGISGENIRAAWLGCQLPLATEIPTELREARDKGLFVVAKEVALDVLRSAGKMLAVRYWEDHCGSGFFCFRPEHCEEVPGN